MQQGATIYETNSSPTHFYCAENRFTSEPPPSFVIDCASLVTMRCNDFALANAVLRAVPCLYSRKSFHHRAIRHALSPI